MKSLIIGEVTNNELNSGTLEIISKVRELNLEYEVVTVGSSDVSKIGSDEFTNTYFKSNCNGFPRITMDFHQISDEM